MDSKGFRATNHEPRAINRPSAPGLFKQKNSREEAGISGDLPAPENLGDKTATLRNFRDLKVWQMAKNIAVGTYRITKQFPQEEICGLSSQMRRAAISISSNIAEGFNRFYKKDYRRFLMVALGSCGELESQIEVGAELGYLPKNALTDLLEKLNHENRMLRKLHAALDEKKQPADISQDVMAQENFPAKRGRANSFGY
jgi:four helix bundle protein